MKVIQVPIETSNAPLALPPGDEILYSTLCNCSKTLVSAGLGHDERTTYVWASHVVMTARGIAFIQPDFSQPAPKQGFKDWWNLYISSKHSTSNTYSTPAELKYLLWWDVYSLLPFQKESAQIQQMNINFVFPRVNNESEEDHGVRCTQLIADFLPLIIAEKQKWLEQNQNNPEFKSMRKRLIANSMRKMIQFQGKFAAALEKEKVKAEKAKQKAEAKAKK